MSLYVCGAVKTFNALNQNFNAYTRTRTHVHTCGHTCTNPYTPTYIHTYNVTPKYLRVKRNGWVGRGDVVVRWWRVIAHTHMRGS